jgi:hypothetical protein
MSHCEIEPSCKADRPEDPEHETKGIGDEYLEESGCYQRYDCDGEELFDQVLEGGSVLH